MGERNIEYPAIANAYRCRQPIRRYTVLIGRLLMFLKLLRCVVTIEKQSNKTMNNYKSKLTNEMFDKIQKIEVDIRGRYMRVSAHSEALLVKNLMLLHEEKCVKYKISTPLNLKGVMFDHKISMLKSYLKRQHSDLYKKYEKLFNNLLVFKRVRNNMAHSYFEWDEKDISCLWIWELQLDEEPNFFKKVKYTFETINKTFRDLVGPIIDDLNNVTYDLEVCLKPKLPYMFEEEDNNQSRTES